jgi:hypothetical protein
MIGKQDQDHDDPNIGPGGGKIEKERVKEGGSHDDPGARKP